MFSKSKASDKTIKLSNSDLHEIYGEIESTKNYRFCQSKLNTSHSTKVQRRRLNRIFISSRGCSPVSTPISDNEDSNKSSYKELTRSSTVRNRLISLPITRVSKINFVEQEHSAAIKIQSLVRRYLVIRKYYIYEKQRKANRIQILEDAMSSSKHNLDIHLLKSNIVNLENHIRYLVRELKAPETKIEKIKSILNIFFFCLAVDGTISLHELVLLICDIIKLPYKKSDFYSSLNNKTNFHVNDRIKFDVLCSIFTSYKLYHGFPSRKCYSKIVDYFSNDDIPLFFIIQFNSYQVKMYDVIYSIRKYDIVNPKLFKCELCSISFITPLDYIHHKVHYHA